MRWVRSDVIAVSDSPGSGKWKYLRLIILPLIEDVVCNDKTILLNKANKELFTRLDYQTPQDAAEAAAEIRQAWEEWREKNA